MAIWYAPRWAAAFGRHYTFVVIARKHAGWRPFDRIRATRRGAGRAMLLATLLAGLGGERASGLPPLTDEQRVRLETAHDGRDHREEAFVALVESVASWDGRQIDEPVRLAADPARLIVEPETYRGEAFQLRGRLAQVATLAPPHDAVREWFLRDEDGRPLLVYVVPTVDVPAAALDRMRPGQPVTIMARFYKVVDDVARDGEGRRYAAFVGAAPTVAVAEAPSGAMLPILLPVLLVLLVIVMALVAWISRQRRSRDGARLRLGGEVPTELDDSSTLPEDPADALTELKRRIEQTP